MSEQFDLIVLGSGSGARDGANKAALAHICITLPHMGRGRQSRRGAGPGFAAVEGGYDRRFAPTHARRR